MILSEAREDSRDPKLTWPPRRELRTGESSENRKFREQKGFILPPPPRLLRILVKLHKLSKLCKNVA